LAGIEPGAAWQDVQRLTVTGLTTALPLTATNRQPFYRAVRPTP